MTISVMYLIR